MNSVQRPEPISGKDSLGGELASEMKHEYVGGRFLCDGGSEHLAQSLGK
jgi:hypothetical protein